MKKVFMLLLLTHSFQGFLLAQENSNRSFQTETVSNADAVSVKDNALDDFDAMLDADAAMGDVVPMAAPKKNSVDYLALCASVVKQGLAITYENLMRLKDIFKSANKKATVV